MSAISLYDALHSAIMEQVTLDDPLNVFEIVGALEMVKHDIMNDADEDDDGEPMPMNGACSMPEAA
jgi:hypothetical protein